MRHAKVFNIISVITFCLAVFFLFSKGLNYSIEFTGGVVFETSHEKSADLDKIRQAISSIGFLCIAHGMRWYYSVPCHAL